MKNIAILVPSYNSATTVEGTMRSILDQGTALDQHIDFLMLSDDGSKDHTVEIVTKVWTHPAVPLRIRRAEINQGEYRNVNGAFAAMPPHIKWVVLMHADNQALPGWIETLARECRRADERTATICGSWHYVCGGKLTDSGDARGPDYVEIVEGNRLNIRGSIFRGCWWHNSTAAIRVAAWKSVGGHPQDTPLLTPLEILGFRKGSPPGQRRLRVKGDWDVMLRFLSSGWSICYVGTPLIRYIEEAISVSAGSFSWHGDLLETLQVMRRHQSALSLPDIIQFHCRVTGTLGRRFTGAVLRGRWRRAGYALNAFPYAAASLIASTWSHFRSKGGRLDAIPFGPESAGRPV